MSCHHFYTDVSFFFRELLVNALDNLIIAAAEIDATFDFAIYLCSQNFTFTVQNLCCFYATNVVADGKIFHCASTLPENVLLLFLKAVSQHIFTFASTFVFIKQANKAILDVFENRGSSFEARFSRLKNRGSRTEFRDSRIFFQGLDQRSRGEKTTFDRETIALHKSF